MEISLRSSLVIIGPRNQSAFVFDQSPLHSQNRVHYIPCLHMHINRFMKDEKQNNSSKSLSSWSRRPIVMIKVSIALMINSIGGTLVRCLWTWLKFCKVVKKRKLTVRKLQIYFSLDKWGNFFCTIVLWREFPTIIRNEAELRYQYSFGKKYCLTLVGKEIFADPGLLTLFLTTVLPGSTPGIITLKSSTSIHTVDPPPPWWP